MQLEFLWKELSGGYGGLLSTLKSAESVTGASTAFLTQFEKPADQGAAVQKKRASYGQGYYDKYGGKAGTGTKADTLFKVKVAAADLRIRKGPGTDYAATGKYTGAGTFTITEVKSGKGSAAGWGKLKSGAGWISLDHAKRI